MTVYNLGRGLGGISKCEKSLESGGNASLIVSWGCSKHCMGLKGEIRVVYGEKLDFES